MAKSRPRSMTLGERMNSPNMAGYVFILPFIIGLVVFTVIPFFTSLYLAFTEYNVLSPAKWVGLNNFRKMFFEDKLFWTSFWVTFKFALIQVPVKLAVSSRTPFLMACCSVTGMVAAEEAVPSAVT